MLVGLNVPTNFQIYGQKSEKALFGGAIAPLPPPPPPRLATLMTTRRIKGCHYHKPNFWKSTYMFTHLHLWFQWRYHHLHHCHCRWTVWPYLLRVFRLQRDSGRTQSYQGYSCTLLLHTRCLLSIQLMSDGIKQVKRSPYNFERWLNKVTSHFKAIHSAYILTSTQEHCLGNVQNYSVESMSWKRVSYSDKWLSSISLAFEQTKFVVVVVVVVGGFFFFGGGQAIDHKTMPAPPPPKKKNKKKIKNKNCLLRAFRRHWLIYASIWMLSNLSLLWLS